MSELASSGQIRMALVRRALITIPACVVLGFISGAIGNAGPENLWYSALEKPSFQPPSWAFGVVWTILYVLMGLALAIVLNARGSRFRGYAVGLFIVQFLFNLAWSPVVFGMHQITWGLVILAFMFVFAVAATIAFWRVRTNAALLMLPYLAWLCLAGALNFELRNLNPDADGLVLESGGSQIDLTR